MAFFKIQNRKKFEDVYIFFQLRFVDFTRVSEKEIDEIIQDGDLEKLEFIILSGKGHELKGKSSWNGDVRKFLKNAPSYSV